jgi:hypothetical protein
LLSYIGCSRGIVPAASWVGNNPVHRSLPYYRHSRPVTKMLPVPQLIFIFV